MPCSEACRCGRAGSCADAYGPESLGGCVILPALPFDLEGQDRVVAAMRATAAQLEPLSAGERRRIAEQEWRRLGGCGPDNRGNADGLGGGQGNEDEERIQTMNTGKMVSAAAEAAGGELLSVDDLASINAAVEAAGKIRGILKAFAESGRRSSQGWRDAANSLLADIAPPGAVAMAQEALDLLGQIRERREELEAVDELGDGLQKGVAGAARRGMPVSVALWADRGLREARILAAGGGRRMAPAQPAKHPYEVKLDELVAARKCSKLDAIHIVAREQPELLKDYRRRAAAARC